MRDEFIGDFRAKIERQAADGSRRDSDRRRVAAAEIVAQSILSVA